MGSSDSEKEKLDLARQLVAELEQGNGAQSDKLLAELAGFGANDSLFQEVGRLTRNLHESIKTFVLDGDFEQMINSEVPDAAQRLQYVIETTEKAANDTMDAVEESLPLTELLKNDANHLAERWNRFNSRELTVEDFKVLSREIDTFLASTQENSNALHDKLSEVLMAQGFQDITGQIIRKVIVLVQEVEQKLVELVALSSQRVEESEKQKMAKEEVKEKEIDGPVVPGVDHGDTVNSQDEVDDLLSSLGF